MTNPFSQNYITPKNKSDFFRFEDGANLFRILTPKEQVVSYFVEYQENQDGIKTKICTPDLGNGKKPSLAKICWAFVIFNKKTNSVEVAEISQKSIQDFLFSTATGKIKNDWTKFDIQITKAGQSLETKYHFITDDVKELENDDLVEISIKLPKIDLKKMATGESPFLQN